MEAPAAITVVPERGARPHPPLQESSLRLARRLTEDATPDERLTAVADQQLPTEIAVWCWDDGAWNALQGRMNRELRPADRGAFAGIADLYAFDIHLSPGVSETLADFDSTADELSAAEALLVLAHEIRHFGSSGSNEAGTECAALQRVDDTARALGASEDRATALARIAWETLYPGNRPEYRSDQCRPGGALDNDPSTPAFP